MKRNACFIGFYSDFIVIRGDNSFPIAKTSSSVLVHDSFNTGGRESGSPALLFMSAKDLGGTAKVLVNDTEVGTINSTPGPNWSTQLMQFQGSVLKNGNNKIVVKDMTNAFLIKDVVCFFHQSA